MRWVVLSTTIDTSAPAGPARMMPPSSTITDEMALRIDLAPVLFRSGLRHRTKMTVENG
jgi:hypothetical protein